MGLRHLPGHHAAKAGPSAPAHQETHCRVGDGVPGPAHKQDDGGMGGIQLQGGSGKRVRHETETKRMPNATSYGAAGE